MKKILNKFIFCILTVFVLCVFPFDIAAASILELQQQSYTEKALVMNIVLDTEGNKINAFESKVTFSSNVEWDGTYRLAIPAVTWIVKPYLSAPGVIEFSGIIPGGYDGVRSPGYQGTRKASLLSLTFVPGVEGAAAFQFKDTAVLLHDGMGTKDTVVVRGATAELRKISTISKMENPKASLDVTPPEPFTVMYGKNESMLEGKWFAVFSAVDRESEVLKYEIQESTGDIDQSRWENAVSPYILKDQSLKSNIYVRAVDRSGNERVATLRAPMDQGGDVASTSWLILVLLASTLILVIARMICRGKVI